MKNINPDKLIKGEPYLIEGSCIIGSYDPDDLIQEDRIINYILVGFFKYIDDTGLPVFGNTIDNQGMDDTESREYNLDKIKSLTPLKTSLKHGKAVLKQSLIDKAYSRGYNAGFYDGENRN